MGWRGVGAVGAERGHGALELGVHGLEEDAVGGGLGGGCAAATGMRSSEWQAKAIRQAVTVAAANDFVRFI